MWPKQRFPPSSILKWQTCKFLSLYLNLLRLVDIVVDAIQIIRIQNQPIDLFMIEIMHMSHKLSNETRLVRGLVLDHGASQMKDA
jgi:chaperonin GroEL (HSP60 family)